MSLERTGPKTTRNPDAFFTSCFAALTQWLAGVLPVAAAHPARVAYAAAGVAFLVTLVNLLASRWLPEPPSGILPADAQDV